MILFLSIWFMLLCCMFFGAMLYDKIMSPELNALLFDLNAAIERLKK